MTEQPKVTGISPEGLPVFELKINQPNWYKVDTTKLKTINDVGLLLSSLSMKISTDCEKFDEVKHLLDIPEPRKSLEEIKQELDEKFEKLIERTHLQYRIGHDWTYTLRKYNQFCKDQDADFEYAKRNGYFPVKLKFVSNTELSVNNTTTSFEIRCGTNNAGYYTIGAGNVRYYMNKKPNWLVRNCAKIFFDFTWKDTP
jgi:hypothetical protein